MAHGFDSEHDDWVAGYWDTAGEFHEGNYDPEDYADVDRLLIQLPEELRSGDSDDKGYRTIGVFFTDEYDLDDVYDDVEDTYGTG